MIQRLRYLLRFYLVTVLVFIIAKWAFMICCHEDPLAFTDFLQVPYYGLSLDLSTALYFLVIPFVLTIISSVARVPSWIFKVYNGFVAIAFALAFLADNSLYVFWKFKLDASCLQYLETPTDAMASVTTGYLLVRLVLWIILAALLYVLYERVAKRPLFQGGRWAEIPLNLLLTAVIVIGARGGLSESTTNIGQVYYSHNQFLNHAAVNPLFSFFASMSKSGDYLVSYDYYTEEECQALTDSLFFVHSEDTDTLLRTHRPNIVMILMESCGGQFTELGGHPEITPRLNQLTHEGIYFTECYANSWRTDKAVVSILSGYPAFPITSVMKVPEKSRKLPSIAASLQRAGYDTGFYYGGDINFTNMRSYVLGTGYKHLRWKEDYSRQEQKSAQWGVRDDLMFASLLQDIQEEPSKHWMKTLLTLSSHEPWDVPTKDLEDEVYNSFHYLDRCIGQFIDSLKQTPQWDDLLVIILPDHGYRYQGIDERTRLYNHIPMLWVGGAVKAPRHIQRICNQSDLAATLLGQLDLDHSAFTFSRDVASSHYQADLAWHTYNNGVSVFDTTGFMSYDLDALQIVASEGQETERQLQVARAILQLTSHDLINK